ncbi:MAG: glycoside hydrolase family 66 protein [Ktedonobacterales bacterium]
MSIEIRDVWPERATYRPDEAAAAHLSVHLVHTGEATAVTTPRRFEIGVHLSWLHDQIGAWRYPVELSPGEDVALRLPLPLPVAPFRGYGVVVEVRGEGGQILARRSTAIDVLDSWTQAPRYGFLSDFAPGDTAGEAHAAALARYHINVAQFYDWMWRHFELMPPTEDFTDALGRSLSLRSVRAKVAACHHYGIAALGYAAVYGAEPEYIESHPDEMVFDENGKPYSLDKLFYIMNLAPDSPWRSRMLQTMREAVRDVPFDGLHLDQYGFPKESAFDSQGRAYDMAADFATFINEARAAIQLREREARVIFNAVENWPIELVAPTDQDAVYIEVWPPYVQYRDLQQLIVAAQHLAPDKQVILAAYMKPLGDAAALDEAEAATRLTSAAIWANGGFHLLLGEQDAALYDPYYVKHALLLPEFARVMRDYYDFVVRYMNILSDRRLTLCDGETVSARTATIDGYHVSTNGDAGTIWIIERAMPGYRTISFINLTTSTDANWNVPTSPAVALEALPVRLRLDDHENALQVRRVFAATPDDGSGTPVALAFSLHREADGTTGITFELPHLAYWTLVYLETESD